MMKRCLIVFVLVFLSAIAAQPAFAQCSICTKTAMQQGEGAASGLNAGIIYLMFTPFIVVGYISYRWWKTEKQFEGDNN